MPRARGWLVALLVGLGLVWAALTYVGPGSRASRLTPERTDTPGAGIATSGLRDLDAATARMQAELGAAAARQDSPRRNPFRFGGDPAAGPSDPASPATLTPLRAVDPAALRPAAPVVILVGLVERTVDGRRERTAVLSMNGELHYVVAGQQMRGDYEVITVGADAVELRSLADGSTRRLVQR
jgi:hypothetical protein